MGGGGEGGDTAHLSWVLREFELVDMLINQLELMQPSDRRRCLMSLQYALAAADLKQDGDVDGFSVLQALLGAGFRLHRLNRVRLLRAVEEMGGKMPYAELCQVGGGVEIAAKMLQSSQTNHRPHITASFTKHLSHHPLTPHITPHPYNTSITYRITPHHSSTPSPLFSSSLSPYLPPTHLTPQVLLRSCADWTSEERSVVKKILSAMGITVTDRRGWLARLRQDLGQAAAAHEAHRLHRKLADTRGAQGGSRVRATATSRYDHPPALSYDSTARSGTGAGGSGGAGGVGNPGISPAAFLHCLRENRVLLTVEEEAALLDCLDVERLAEKGA